MYDETITPFLKKQARLKEIPDGWRLGTVGNDCRVCNQLRLPISAESRRSMKGEFPYYGPTGIIDFINEYRLDGTYALIGEDGDHFFKYSQREMTQLIHGKANVNNHAHIIDSNSTCLAEWFFLYFMHRNITHFLSRQGVGRFKLNKATLNKLPILLPPINEQKKIFSIVSIWDSAIENVIKLRKLKEKKKKALMQKLFNGENGNKKFERQNWRNVRLCQIFTERKETNHNHLPLLSITADRGVINRDELEKKDTSNTDKSKYKRIAPGDIGYNTMRMWQGNSGVSSLEGIVSPAYTICTPQKNIDSNFAGYLFKYPPIIHLFHRFSQGLVSDTLNLKFNNFAQIKVKIPELKEQQKIANVFKCCDREIDQLCKLQDSLQLQKRGLLHKLVTGEIRISY